MVIIAGGKKALNIKLALLNAFRVICAGNMNELSVAFNVTSSGFSDLHR